MAEVKQLDTCKTTCQWQGIMRAATRHKRQQCVCSSTTIARQMTYREIVRKIWGDCTQEEQQIVQSFERQTVKSNRATYESRYNLLPEAQHEGDWYRTTPNFRSKTSWKRPKSHVCSRLPQKDSTTGSNGPTATMDHSNSNFHRHSFAIGYLIMKCMKISCHENPEYTVNQCSCAPNRQTGRMPRFNANGTACYRQLQRCKIL